MNNFTAQQRKDLKVLIRFVGIFCRYRHEEADSVAVELPPEVRGVVHDPLMLCTECAGLVQYAIKKRQQCPLEPKPSCKKCHIHCYSREYRARIREIMAFSGRKMIMRGRIDYLWHYFF